MEPDVFVCDLELGDDELSNNYLVLPNSAISITYTIILFTRILFILVEFTKKAHLNRVATFYEQFIFIKCLGNH